MRMSSRERARRRRGLVASLLALGCAGAASADSQRGSLDEPATSARYYQVTCSDDGSGPPMSLVTQIRDDSPDAPPLVSVQIQKGSLATNGTDATDADSAFGPAVWVNGGSGVYNVFVDKTEAGPERFTLSFQCMTGANGTGVPTGTSIFPSAVQVPAVPLPGWIALAASLLVGARRAWPRRGRRGPSS
jgi:hypothetical protein